MFTRILPALILSIAATTVVVAQLSGTSTPEPDPPVTITLELHEAEIGVVLDLIAKQSGMNLVVASDVTGRVSATLKDVPWRDALEAIVKTAGYAWVEEEIGASSFLRIGGSRVDERIVEATSGAEDGNLEIIRGTIVEPIPFLPAQVPVDETGGPRGPLDLPIARNRTTSQDHSEHAFALALLDYLQESVLTTPLPTSG